MTHEMMHIARRTNIETFSTKIITFMTLSFLTGAFISVCVFFLFAPLSSEFILHMTEKTRPKFEVLHHVHCSTLWELRIHARFLIKWEFC